MEVMNFRVVEPPRDGPAEVVGRLGPAAQRGEGLAAHGPEFGVIVVAFEGRRAGRDGLLPSSGLGMGSAFVGGPERGSTSTRRGPGAGPSPDPKSSGRSQARLIAVSCRPMARKSQMCTQGGSLVVTTRRSAVQSEGGRRQFTEIGAFETCQRSARFGLDQANDPISVLHRQHAAVGGKAVTRAANLPRLAPGSDGPEPAR